MSTLIDQFGQIDIYLFDQILRGRIAPGMSVFDAGCGAGRNLVYLLRHCKVFGADSDSRAIQAVRQLAATLAPRRSPDNFRHEAIEEMSFPDSLADVVISSAVLHFASCDDHFQAMLEASWRVLKPGGLFFCRLASSIGIEHQVRPIDGRRCLLPDGSQRYLVDAALLDQLTAQLGAAPVDALKTTLVRDQRSMTTWVLRKNTR